MAVNTQCTKGHESCATCGKELPAKDGHASGYGLDSEGRKHCYQCCAEREKAQILKDGKGMLYLCMVCPPRIGGYYYFGWLTPTEAALTDWGGALSIPIKRVKRGGHNIAHCRYDVWFSWEGREWHGVTVGENTQICHIKAIKSKGGA